MGGGGGVNRLVQSIKVILIILSECLKMCTQADSFAFKFNNSIYIMVVILMVNHVIATYRSDDIDIMCLIVLFSKELFGYRFT